MPPRLGGGAPPPAEAGGVEDGTGEGGEVHRGARPDAGQMLAEPAVGGGAAEVVQAAQEAPARVAVAAVPERAELRSAPIACSRASRSRASTPPGGAAGGWSASKRCARASERNSCRSAAPKVTSSARSATADPPTGGSGRSTGAVRTSTMSAGAPASTSARIGGLEA